MDQIKKVYNTLTRSSNTSLPLVTLILERKFITDIYLVFEPSQYFSRKKLERTEDFLNFKWGNTDKQNAFQRLPILLDIPCSINLMNGIFSHQINFLCSDASACCCQLFGLWTLCIFYILYHGSLLSSPVFQNWISQLLSISGVDFK